MGSRTILGPLAIVLLLTLAVIWQIVPRDGIAGASARAGEVDGAKYRLTREAAWDDGAPRLPDPAPLRFAGEVAQADRDSILAALGATRPEAHRLLDLVSSVVEVSVRELGPGEMGRTVSTGETVRVEVDLRAAERLGPRGAARVVLHQFGHVLDHTLVPTGLEERLETATPAPWGCDVRPQSCAREERFAESFAKWASGDAELLIGHGPQTPPPSAAWGALVQGLR